MAVGQVSESPYRPYQRMPAPYRFSDKLAGNYDETVVFCHNIDKTSGARITRPTSWDKDVKIAILCDVLLQV